MMRATTPLIIAAFAPAALAAQTGPNPGVQQETAADSTATVEALQDAQRRFERVRHQHLPWTWTYSGGRCDVIVGRFCYWDDDSDYPWTRPEEPETVALARHELLAQLDSASRRFPGDPWVQGQRIRYLVESSRYHDALWKVRECGAEPYWCNALAGFVLHVMGDFRAADSTFARAVAAMPTSMRCEWTDLSMLLDGSLRSRYDEIDCAHRDSLNAAVWWLGDPSYLVAGNERRTEHYARHVVTRLFDGSANPYGISWGRDNRELVLRYGWAIGWERQRPRSSVGPTTRPSVVGHHADGALHFLPPAEFVDSPATIAPDAWDLDPYVPRSRYAPGYAKRFSPLRHQLALFRRGDSAVVVAGFDLEESLAASHPGRVRRPGPNAIGGIAVTSAPSDPSAPVIHDLTSPHGVVSTTIPRTAALVGVEVVDRADSSTGRARYWLDVPGRTPDGFAISELLLLEDPDSLPDTLAEAILRARGGNRFAPGEPIGLFWEVYELLPGSVPEVRVTVFKESKGFFQRAAEWIGVADGDRPTMSLGWEGFPSGRDGPTPRAVSIRLPTDDTGRYRIRLEIAADGQTAVSETEVEVRE